MNAENMVARLSDVLAAIPFADCRVPGVQEGNNLLVAAEK
jgi:hypothetical protein